MSYITQIPPIYTRSVMRLMLIFFLYTVGIMQACAQITAVTSALSRHGFDTSLLDPANLRLPLDRSFKLKESTTTAGKTKVLAADFVSANVGRERWKLISVDGNTPSLYEVNMFRNTREKSPVDKPDERTYRIDSETTEELVISYKLDFAVIPKDAPFLKDCRAILTLDLKNKELTRLMLKNERPVKIGPLMANKFEIVTRFFFDNTTRRYFPASDDLQMEAAFLGKKVSTRVETVYSDYAPTK